MAESQAYIGEGLTFSQGQGDGPPETFTPVTEIVNVQGPNVTKNTVDVTHYLSPNGYMEFIGGFKDGGEVTLTMAFLPGDATQDQTTGLLADFDSDAKKNYKIIFPPAIGYDITFAANVTGWNPSFPLEDRVTVDVTLKVSGKPVVAAVV